LLGCPVVGAMTVEVVGFETVQGPAENSAEEDKPVSQEIENGKLEEEAEVADAITFGSNGDKSAKPEAEVAPDSNAVPDSDVPKDAVEEWPAPKQIHYFYFVRFRPYDDPTIKANLDKLDKEMSQKNQARIKVTDALKAKRVSSLHFCHPCLIT